MNEVSTAVFTMVTGAKWTVVIGGAKDPHDPSPRSALVGSLGKPLNLLGESAAPEETLASSMPPLITVSRMLLFAAISVASVTVPLIGSVRLMEGITCTSSSGRATRLVPQQLALVLLHPNGATSPSKPDTHSLPGESRQRTDDHRRGRRYLHRGSSSA